MNELSGMPSLHEITTQARSIHERLLDSSLGHRQTQGSCLHACILLSSMLERFGNCKAVTIRGGDGQGDGGYVDAAGVWHGHYWIEADDGSGALVMDITADQFGGPAVVVLRKDEARNYVPGSQVVVDEHVGEENMAFARETVGVADT